MTTLKFKTLASKEKINRVKRQPTERERIFANHMSNKEVISKIYKVLQLNTTKKTIKNGQRS